MNRILKIMIISLIVITFSSGLSAKELTIGVGNFKPFFVEQDESGVFLELIKETFRLMPEYEVKYIFMNNEKLLNDLNAGIIDGAANIFKGANPNACLSDPIFRYKDVAVSLSAKNLKIDKISDLKDKSIAAYEGAKILLGREFKNAVISNPGYEEFPDTFVTTDLMVNGQKYLRIGDIFIFLYEINSPLYKKKKLKLDDFKVHALFPDVYSHMGFKDKKVCDDFNRTLKVVKENGIFDAVYKKYELFLKVGLR